MPHKTALITGANKGIGFEIARQLAGKEFHVILAGRNEAAIHDAVSLISEDGGACSPLIMDVADPASIHSGLETTRQMTSRLNVLVNNAAVLLDEHTAFLDVTSQVLEDTLKINALGPLYVTRAFLPLLGKGSRVIQMSSSAGQICSGTGSWAPAYSMSKTLLNAITMQLSTALQSQGIVVNAMCPGWVKTDMGGSSAPRSVQKGAETAVWLATEAPLSLNGKFVKDKKPQVW